MPCKTIVSLKSHPTEWQTELGNVCCFNKPVHVAAYAANHVLPLCHGLNQSKEMTELQHFFTCAKWERRQADGTVIQTCLSFLFQAVSLVASRMLWTWLLRAITHHQLSYNYFKYWQESCFWLHTNLVKLYLNIVTEHLWTQWKKQLCYPRMSCLLPDMDILIKYLEAITNVTFRLSHTQRS